MKLSDDFVTTCLGIWKAGAAYLPIETLFTENRVEHILTEARPVLVIYDDSYPNVRFFAKQKSIKFSNLKRESNEMESDNIPDELTLTKGSPDTKAVAMYTSGSSGPPKGVRISHHSLHQRINWQLVTYPYEESENFCCFKTAINFGDHLAELWCPLIAGKALVVVPRDVSQDTEKMVSLLEEYKIARLFGVPSLLRSLLLYVNTSRSTENGPALSRLSLWISSGEPLTIQFATEFFDYFKGGKNILVNFYGCTETSCEVLFYELVSEQQVKALNRIPIGTPFFNTIVYILDTPKKPLPEGEIGEIYVAGAFVDDGYINGRDPGAFLKNSIEPIPRKLQCTFQERLNIFLS